jgi:DNA-binding MarR family transcriptional regulator
MNRFKQGGLGIKSARSPTANTFLRSIPVCGNPSEACPSADELLSLAKRLMKMRKGRSPLFPPELFGEPAWDMLIALFCAEAEGRRITVTNLCNESRGPSTTAMRWINSLTELGLVRRHPNPPDGRVIFLELNLNGREALNEYLCQTWALLYDPA